MSPVSGTLRSGATLVLRSSLLSKDIIIGQEIKKIKGGNMKKEDKRKIYKAEDPLWKNIARAEKFIKEQNDKSS